MLGLFKAQPFGTISLTPCEDQELGTLLGTKKTQVVEGARRLRPFWASIRSPFGACLQSGDLGFYQKSPLLSIFCYETP